MKKYLIIFLSLPIISFSQFTEKKIYNINKIDKSPHIDGDLNDDQIQEFLLRTAQVSCGDEAWSAAAV